MKTLRQRLLTATNIAVTSVALLGTPRVSPAQTPNPVPSSPIAGRERDAFLLTASILNDGAPDSGTRRSSRITLDDGQRTHDALVETADGSGPTRRDHRFNVAAYELDKALGLNLVVPAVERPIDGRPASVTWLVDTFAMNEADRRRKAIAPPDLDSWNRQMDAVRVFDELISNTYRDISPPLYLNSVWDNLLITSDWTIWLTDHTGAFRTRARLESPESLVRCDRALLGRLRQLNGVALRQRLAKYLSATQLETLEVRRRLIVKHFDGQIAKKGEAAVLYDRPCCAR
jgi:hypothetical protein